MAEVHRGIVTQEFQKHASAINGVHSLAQALLDVRRHERPAELKARSWDELSRAEQLHEAGELIQLPELGYTFSIEQLVTTGLSPTACQAFDDALAAYRDSLPFTGGELAWFTEQCWDADAKWDSPDSPVATPMAWVAAQRGTIVSGGQQRTADGAELVSREWNWVRGGGEFSGNSTYDAVTKEALLGIVAMWEHKPWS